ncbi:hypothetical protein D9615_000293 [Tricholomella constricta]|uniref:Uncharacterized protein n=1 Tax=Tricholomella constricta TaxID=117010 RepID=A0A8H5HR14_9AGAR|nr:hypothetical protein D9615_000293 [Tricholomella constricta]
MTPIHQRNGIISRLSIEWTHRVFANGPTSREHPRDGPVRPWKLPSSLQAHTESVISCAWKPSTSAGYSRAIQQFFTFCSDTGVPPSACLPASEDLLCAFAASFSGLLAGNSIRSKCAALRSWHILNGLPWLGGTHLSYTIKGCEASRPASSFASKRAPVTSNMLSTLLSGLDLNDCRDSCVASVATTAFWGQLRLGELLPDRESLVPERLLPSWSHLGPPNANGSRVLHLPQSKTSGSAGEDVVIMRQSAADPVACLLGHQRINAVDDSWLLSWYRSSDGMPVALSKRKFLARCNSILAGVGFPPISGHSFHIGGTTHFLLADVPPDVVKLMGRWSSDSFFRYWHCLEIIAPLHAELLQPLFDHVPSFSPPA